MYATNLNFGKKLYERKWPHISDEDSDLENICIWEPTHPPCAYLLVLWVSRSQTRVISLPLSAFPSFPGDLV